MGLPAKLVRSQLNFFKPFVANCSLEITRKGQDKLGELMEAIHNGTLEEAWGTGTAAVVSPIGVLNYEGKEYTVGNGGIGEVTQKLYDELTAIQWGKRPDPFGWVDPVC